MCNKKNCFRKKLFFISKLKSINKIDTILLLLILLLSVFLRFYNLHEYALGFGDELYLVNLINNLKKFNILGEIGSTYIPTIILKNFFFFINSYPKYRYINAFMGVINVFITYLAARQILESKKLQFLVVFVLSIQTWYLFTDRKFIVDWSAVLFPSLVLLLYFKCEKTKHNYFLLIISFIIGLALINQGVVIYYIIPLFFWLFYLFIKKEIKFPIFIFIVIIFLITISPFIIAIKNTNYESFLKGRYAYWDINYKNPIFINIIYINKFFQVFSNFMFGNWDSISVPYQISLIFLFTPLIICLIYRKSLNKGTTFLLYLSYGVILTMLFSFIPLYHAGIYLFFFPSYIFLLIKQLNIKNRQIQLVVLSIIFIIITFNLINTKNLITKNSYMKLSSVEKYIIDKNVSRIFVQEASYELIKYSPFFKNISSQYIVFKCSFREILNIEDIIKNAQIGDIIISRFECNVNNAFLNSKFIIIPISKIIDETMIYEIKNRPN